MLRPHRAEIPIYLAAMSPKAVEQTAEIARRLAAALLRPREGARAVPGAVRARVEIAASVPALVSDDVQAARDALKGYYSFYIGSMGSRKTNFYNQIFARYGYEREAAEIQEPGLAGRQRDAAALVPDSFVDEARSSGRRSGSRSASRPSASRAPRRC